MAKVGTTFVVCLLLLVPLLAGRAEAIVVTCGAGFPCNPATGLCSTQWEAYHRPGGGPVVVFHGECSLDPSSCFEQMYKDMPPPGSGLFNNWGISPVGVTCDMPAINPLLMAVKSDFEWIGLRNYIARIEKRIARLNRGLDKGIAFGDPTSTRATLARQRLSWLYTISSLLWPLVVDPPNPNYASFPGPSTAYPLVSLPAPDATMTAAQITQHSVWLNAMRDTAIVMRQLSEIQDKIAGALRADEAGDLAAAPWVGPLAAQFDAVAATVAQKGALEIAARSGITGPVVVEPADCATALNAANALTLVVKNGGTMYQASLAHAEIEGTCANAATYPALLTDDGGHDAAAYAGFMTMGMYPYLCAGNPAYCATTLMKVAPGSFDYGALPVGAFVAKQFKITNKGLGSLKIGALSLIGTNPTQFSLKNNYCSGQSLGPEAQCTFVVKFLPDQVGALEAKVKILSNLPLKKVQLLGTGR